MTRPTISDVARAAGVTKATVSHAYSGNRPISAATRTRVFAAAKELHWVPSSSARALELGTQCSSFAAANTRVRVAALIGRFPL